MPIQIPKKLGWVFEGEADYRGAYGGRGSAKSATFATMLLLQGIADPGVTLCTREIQSSIRDSVHAEIEQQINFHELDAFYEVGEKFVRGRRGTPAYGTDFIYRGLLRNYSAIKSIAGVKRCWVEEAEYVSESSFDYLIPTIRKPGSEIWLTWNPERTDSPVKKRFLDNPPPKCRIAEVNWRDNPWFPEKLNRQRLTDLARDPEKALHIWEGQCTTRSDAQILHGKWIVQEFTPGPDWDGPYQGSDWGFAEDPTVGTRSWIHDHKLYVEYEAWGQHVESRDIGNLFATIPGFAQYKTYGDCARPETISEVKHQGFDIEACEKWQGSVEDGIEHLRGQYDKIVLHPRCPHVAQECQLYSYKVDRLTNNVLPDVVDKWNHGIDSLRYSLGPIIQRRGKGFFDM